jgi:hypothetical protein
MPFFFYYRKRIHTKSIYVHKEPLYGYYCCLYSIKKKRKKKEVEEISFCDVCEGMLRYDLNK